MSNYHDPVRGTPDDEPRASCPREDKLHAWIDGELEAQDSSQVNTHVASCTACRETTAIVRALNDLVAQPEPAPPTLAADILSSRPSRNTRSFSRFAAAAMALVGMGLLGYALGNARRPSTLASKTRVTSEEAHPPARLATQDSPSPSVDSPKGAKEGEPAVEDAPEPTVRERLARALTASPTTAHALLLEHRREATAWLHTLAKDADAARARAAIAHLSEFGDRRSVNVLGSLLSDPTRGEAALKTLTAIGSEEAAEVILDDRVDLDERRRFVALASMGDMHGIGVMLDRESDSFASRTAVRAAIDRVPDMTTPVLLSIAEGDDPRRATRALAHLERMRPARVVARLSALLDREYTRIAAARVLASIDTAESVEAMLRMRPSPTVDATFSLVGPQGESILIERLKSKSWRTRTRAIDLLGRCGGVDAARALATLTSEPAIAPPAVAAIGRIGEPLSVEILDQLSAHAQHRIHIVRALGTTGLGEAVPVLLRLGRQERRLRSAAIEALALVPMSAAVEAIVRLDGRRRLSTPTKDALLRMDDELVRTTLSAMLDGPHSAAAQRAIQRMTRDFAQPGTR